MDSTQRQFDVDEIVGLLLSRCGEFEQGLTTAEHEKVLAIWDQIENEEAKTVSISQKLVDKVYALPASPSSKLSLDSWATRAESPFLGQHVMERTCTNCNVPKPRKLGTFLTFDLPIRLESRYIFAASGKTLNLVDMLNEKHESTLVDIHCDDCRMVLPFSEKTFMTRLPEYLVCIIGRFANGRDGDKVTNNIMFPVDGLDLRRYAHPSGCVDQHYMYSCQAALHHRGTTLRAGHYVCYVREGSEWVLYNDKVVSIVPQEEIMVSLGVAASTDDPTDLAKGSNCYMILYQRQQSQAPPPPVDPPSPPWSRPYPSAAEETNQPTYDPEEFRKAAEASRQTYEKAKNNPVTTGGLLRILERSATQSQKLYEDAKART